MGACLELTWKLRQQQLCERRRKQGSQLSAEVWKGGNRYNSAWTGGEKSGGHGQSLWTLPSLSGSRGRVELSGLTPVHGRPQAVQSAIEEWPLLGDCCFCMGLGGMPHSRKQMAECPRKPVRLTSTGNITQSHQRSLHDNRTSSPKLLQLSTFKPCGTRLYEQHFWIAQKVPQTLPLLKRITKILMADFFLRAYWVVAAANHYFLNPEPFRAFHLNLRSNTRPTQKKTPVCECLYSVFRYSTLMIKQCKQPDDVNFSKVWLPPVSCMTGTQQICVWNQYCNRQV